MAEPRSGPRRWWRGGRSWMSLHLLALLAGGALSAGCSAAIDPQAIADVQTAARVKTVLVNDPDLGGRTIEVRVVGGVAHLTGRVLSPEEATRAQALARSVPGVRDVESRLQVGQEAVAVETDGPQSGGRPDLDQELRDLHAPPGLLAVGASISRTQPWAGALDSRVSVGPIIKLGSGRGAGFVLGFNWFQADLTSRAPDGSEGVSRVSVKPFMAGIGYTFGPDELAVTTAVVGGVAFNSLRVTSALGGPLAVDVGNSFVWRPHISVWRNLTRRTVLNVSAGLVRTRLRVTFLEDGFLETRDVSGNTLAFSTGLAYRLF